MATVRKMETKKKIPFFLQWDCCPNTGVIKTTAKSKPKWERKRLTLTSSSLDTEIPASLSLYCPPDVQTWWDRQKDHQNI